MNQTDCDRYGFDTADVYNRWGGERTDWACTCGLCTDVPAKPFGGFIDAPRIDGVFHITDLETS